MKKQVKEQIGIDLAALCLEIGSRHPGSPGNRQAAEYIAGRLSSAGFEMSTPGFDCIDWEYETGTLAIGHESVEVLVSPYSLPCDIESDFETAGSLEELESRDFEGKIALLHGDLCTEQLMPKNFVFYNPEEHQKIIRLLEQKKPLAIIAITSEDPESAGALHPFPLIEDGDFDIPSVYMTEEQGQKLLQHRKARLHLVIRSQRIPSRGVNVIGMRNGRCSERIVLCAHLDTKMGTPGALDNGTGIAVLLAVADLLKDYEGEYGIQIVAMNGEDYYAQSGEMLYLEQYQDSMEQTVLAVNIDSAGYRGCRSSFCTFGCEGALLDVICQAFGDEREFVMIEPWHQGDHMLFAMNEVPAVALSSENLLDVTANIAHTERDTLEGVDAGRLAEMTHAICELIERLNGSVRKHAL